MISVASKDGASTPGFNGLGMSHVGDSSYQAMASQDSVSFKMNSEYSGAKPEPMLFSANRAKLKSKFAPPATAEPNRTARNLSDLYDGVAPLYTYLYEIDENAEFV